MTPRRWVASAPIAVGGRHVAVGEEVLADEVTLARLRREGRIELMPTLVRMKLVAGTWLEGRHCEPGEIVQVEAGLARMLTQANRGEVLPDVDPDPAA